MVDSALRVGYLWGSVGANGALWVIIDVADGKLPPNFGRTARLAIPKQLRDAVGFTDQTVLYLAPGTDGSLAIYTQEVFDQLGQRLASASPAAEHAFVQPLVLCSSPDG